MSVLDEVCWRSRAERALPEQYGHIAKKWASEGRTLAWAHGIKGRVVETCIMKLKKPGGYVAPRLVEILFDAKVAGAEPDKVRADFPKDRSGDDEFLAYQAQKTQESERIKWSPGGEAYSQIDTEIEAAWGSPRDFFLKLWVPGISMVGTWLKEVKGMSDDEMKRTIEHALRFDESDDPEPSLPDIIRCCRNQNRQEREWDELRPQLVAWIDAGKDKKGEAKERLRVMPTRNAVNAYMLPDYEKSVDEFFAGLGQKQLPEPAMSKAIPCETLTAILA